jgi:hypothetical protein
LTQVVNAESAKIGDVTEQVSSIPSDHANMTKYKSLEDIGFQRVSSQLRQWVGDISNEHSTLKANQATTIVGVVY